MTYIFQPRSPARRGLPIITRQVLERETVQIRLGDQLGALDVEPGSILELASDALGGSYVLVWSPSPKRLLLADLNDLKPAA
jgi:hypothetical protein